MDVKDLTYSNDEPKVVKTDVGAKDGQNKCPKCGATDISTNAKTGKLRCNFCRHEFEPEKIQGMETDISKIEGEIIGSGTQDIVEDTQDIITFKCSSCGAEVVIDTLESTQARCHWCRNDGCHRCRTLTSRHAPRRCRRQIRSPFPDHSRPCAIRLDAPCRHPGSRSIRFPYRSGSLCRRTYDRRHPPRRSAQ